MDDWSTSKVHYSLIRPSVMGNIPSSWLWKNVILFIGLGVYLFLQCTLVIALVATIPTGFIVYFFLEKCFTHDENIFSVYSKFLFTDKYIDASSTKAYVSDLYKN